MSSYTINKTDGSILTDNIADGTVDTTATDLTLIGKNAVNYGEAFNENFVRLLENFANSSSPPNALVGQLWYDTGDGRLKIYNGDGFKVTGGTILSVTAPSNAIAGDIWIDTANQQLHFYIDDDGTRILAGPSYTSSQGVSGLQTVSVFDTAEKEHTISILYNADLLIGIFSKDAFTPSPAINGFTGNIVKGFNLGNASGLLFDVPVTSASQLIDSEDNTYTPDSFVKTTGSSLIAYDEGSEATLTIESDNPLILGSSQNTEIISELAEFKIQGNGTNQSLTFITDTTEGYKGIKIYNTGLKIIPAYLFTGDGTSLVITFGNLDNGAVAEIVEPYQVGDEIEIYYYTIPGVVSSRQLFETAVITAITTTTVTVASAITLTTYDDPGETFDGDPWNGELRKSFLPRVGILNDEPLVELDVNGRGLFRSDLRVKGDTVVEGDLTVLGNTVTSTDTRILDNVITLNDGQVSVVTAGFESGFEVNRGTGNVVAEWKFKENPLNWTSTHSIDIDYPLGFGPALEYRIEGTSVLSATTLGSGVVNSSLTSFGTVAQLQVDDININGSVIESTLPINTIAVNSSRITNLAETVYDSSSPSQLVHGTSIPTSSIASTATVATVVHGTGTIDKFPAGTTVIIAGTTASSGSVGQYNGTWTVVTTTTGSFTIAGSFTDSATASVQGTIQSSTTDDAVSNLTLQKYIAALPLRFNLELTNALGGDLADADVITLLSDTFPVGNHVIGAKIYVQCTKTTMDFDGIAVTPLVVRTLRVYQLISGTPNVWYWDASLNVSYAF